MDTSLLLESPPDRTDENELETQSPETLLPQVIDGVDLLVADLVASWHDGQRLLHPRKWHRVSYVGPLALTPLHEGSLQPNGDSLQCRGRNLSLGGISFEHLAPLPFRVVAVTFLSDAGKALATIATRLNWCRFTRAGNYQSGGRFLRPLPVRHQDSSEWRQLDSA